MKLAPVTGSMVLALVTLLGTASAQPGAAPLAPRAEPAQRPAPSGEPLSETTALALSIGGTVASWGLVVAGAMALSNQDEDRGAGMYLTGLVGTAIAPSFGHWYAGKLATRGLGLRLLGMLTGTVAAVVSLQECGLFESDCEPKVGAVLLIAAGGLYLGGTIDDLVTAPGRVRARNAERGFLVTPVVSPGTGAAGLALAGSF